MAKTAKKALTKAQIASQIAEEVGLSKKQVTAVLQSMTTLAYKEARNSFVLPGLGKLILADRPARKMIMRFGPDVGKEKLIPKSKKLKFRFAKSAKEAILGMKK